MLKNQFHLKRGEDRNIVEARKREREREGENDRDCGEDRAEEWGNITISQR